MIKILEYGYTAQCDYSLSEKECFFWKDATNLMEGEYLSWYEVGQLLGGN